MLSSLLLLSLSIRGHYCTRLAFAVCGLLLSLPRLPSLPKALKTAVAKAASKSPSCLGDEVSNHSRWGVFQAQLRLLSDVAVASKGLAEVSTIAIL